jgi:hypothetical protein
MRTTRGVVIGLALVAAGCGGHVDDQDPGKGAALADPPGVGTYALDDGQRTGNLTIKSVAPLRFDLAVINKDQAANFGEIEDAEANDGRVIFGDDCTIDVQIDDRAVSITQTGPCASAGFGAGVDASGEYYETGAPSGGGNAAAGGDDLLATYYLDNDTRSGTLTIESLDPIIFDLSVVNKDAAANSGELDQAQAPGGVYRSDDDCVIAFDLSNGSVTLKQTGACVSAGFGAGVDASGGYYLPQD